MRPLSRRTITPEILRAAFALTRVVQSPPKSLLRVIVDAIEVGYAKVELSQPVSSRR